MSLVPSDATPITIFNFVLMILLGVLCFYQFILFLVGLFRGEVSYPKAKRLHRYAFFIAAHNEEQVIANLVRSIRDQDYPSELIDIFVVADACTDNTAEVARQAGAIVYERNDLARKGKSWVMDYGFRRILQDYPDRHEGFFIFDADNLVSRDYTSIMNDAFDQGYQAITSYRNSKNFGSSWISAAYTTAFIREARFLNNARMLCGTSCAVSGTGYLISANIVRGMQGWRFHTLTEDVQFSAFCAMHGIRIAYAPAEFFDEQPVTFKASWKQRMRWTKGFYQVFFSYGLGLAKSAALFRRFSAYDLFVTVGPGTIVTMLTAVVNVAFLVVGSISHGFLATTAELDSCLVSVIGMLVSSYAMYFAMGLVVCIAERKHFHCAKRWRLVANLFTYPIFMLTYIPINVVALFRKVDWVPTPHNVTVTLDDMAKEPTA